MNFKLILKDYSTHAPLKNAEIELQNIDSKCVLKSISNAAGEVVFSIDKSEIGDFFSVCLKNCDYEHLPFYLANFAPNSNEDSTPNKATQKILTPNNYQNHAAILYFKAKANIVGVLKAYKNTTTASNSLECFLNNWHNEVFTIDSQQTLLIQAFLFAADNKNESIDKNKKTYYQRNLADKATPIKWYYQVLNTDKATNLNISQHANNLIFIPNQCCTNIFFNLSMLENKSQAKRVRIFASAGENEIIYANSINLNTNKTSDKKNRIERIFCVELKIVKTRFLLRFDGENLGFYENERLLKQWQAKSNINIDNGKYAIKLLENGIKLYKNKQFFGQIIIVKNEQKFIEMMEKITIDELPLRVEHKKRIMIYINRIAQTTQSTKSEFSMQIDGINVAKGYILERPGPDCITPNLELRIPAGIYHAAWNLSKNKHKNRTLKLFNDVILKNRGILIHSGKYPQNSRGCLLLEEKMGKENELKRGKSIIAQIRTLFKSHEFKKKFGAMPEAACNIMVEIRNGFEIKTTHEMLYALNKQNGRIYSFIPKNINENFLNQIKMDKKKENPKIMD